MPPMPAPKAEAPSKIAVSTATCSAGLPEARSCAAKAAVKPGPTKCEPTFFARLKILDTAGVLPANLGRAAVAGGRDAAGRAKIGLNCTTARFSELWLRHNYKSPIKTHKDKKEAPEASW